MTRQRLRSDKPWHASKAGDRTAVRLARRSSPDSRTAPVIDTEAGRGRRGFRAHCGTDGASGMTPVKGTDAGHARDKSSVRRSLQAGVLPS